MVARVALSSPDTTNFSSPEIDHATSSMSDMQFDRPGSIATNLTTHPTRPGNFVESEDTSSPPASEKKMDMA